MFSDVLNTVYYEVKLLNALLLLLFYVGTYAQRQFFNTYKQIFSFVHKNKMYKSKYDASITFALYILSHYMENAFYTIIFLHFILSSQSYF